MPYSSRVHKKKSLFYYLWGIHIKFLYKLEHGFHANSIPVRMYCIAVADWILPLGPPKEIRPLLQLDMARMRI